MGSAAQGLETSAALPGHRQGDGLEVEQLEHTPVPIWDASTAGRGLVYSVGTPVHKCSLQAQ